MLQWLWLRRWLRYLWHLFLWRQRGVELALRLRYGVEDAATWFQRQWRALRSRKRRLALRWLRHLQGRRTTRLRTLRPQGHRLHRVRQPRAALQVHVHEIFGWRRRIPPHVVTPAALRGEVLAVAAEPGSVPVEEEGELGKRRSRRQP